jgi:hypothetical protein
MKTKLKADKIVKIEKVPETPRARMRERKVKVTSSVPDHRAEVATEAALPRILLGKISEITTHGTGPIPNAKNAV